MNKKLHFASSLVPLILSGEKTATWRLWDDKDLTKADSIGHEPFTSLDEMYQTYSKYYNRKVTSETEVKLIQFEIIN